MKKRLVICDCFGVIFDDIAPQFLKRYLDDEEAEKMKSKLFDAADLGAITYQELLCNMAKELKIDKEEMEKEWNSMFSVKEDTVLVLKKLKETSDMALLSNAPKGLVEGLFDAFSLTDIFDKMFVSANLKMVKPNEEIYKYVLSNFSDDYEDVYMIDDNLKNLACLSTLNIKAVHFSSAEKMLEEILDKGNAL